MKPTKERNKKGRVFSRREFLKTSAVGAAGLAMGSLINPKMGRAAERPIRFGLFGLCSGAGGVSGECALRGVTLWAEEVNRKGGLLGRKVEVIQRDTMNKPEEAVRYAREFATSGDIDFIFAHGSTSEAFAVAEVSKEIKRLVISINNTTDYTADPKVRSPYCFRTTYNVLQEGITFGKFAEKISKDLGLTRWYTIAADYAFGRDSVSNRMEFLKKFNPKVEIVGQAWPKLFEVDYTPNITAIMAAKPHAVFSGLWGGEVVAFVKQCEMYGVFEKTKFFMGDLANYLTIDPLLKALGKFPSGVYSKASYLRGVPDTKDNHDFCDAYVKRFGDYPAHWSWGNYVGALLIEAAVKKTGTTENEAVIRALKDLSVKAPIGVGPGGTVTMRGRDNQLINYVSSYGVTLSKEPYLTDLYIAPWDKIVEEETIWLKNKGWL